MKISKTVTHDCFVTLIILLIIFVINLLLQEIFDTQTMIPVLFVLAVFLVSCQTQGYFWGVAASLISVLAMNYAFTFPFYAFDLITPECVSSAVVMLIVTTVTCTLTTRLKHQEKLKAEAEKERMRGNLLRAVSHDLRTPLTTISGATSVILENGDMMSDEERRRLLLDIKEDSDWLIGMVENLLSVTRFQAEQAKLNTQPEIVDEVVGDALQKIRKRFPESRVTVLLPDEILMVQMDPILIEQAIINLLENAIRHSGDTEHICLKIYKEDSNVYFEVSDRGKGLEQSRKDAENGDSSRGLGIGLSVCQSIVRAHHGSLVSQDNPLGGTIFRFNLPDLKEEDEDGRY